MTNHVSACLFWGFVTDCSLNIGRIFLIMRRTLKFRGICMKKLLIVAASVLMLTACGQESKQGGHEGHSSSAETKEVKPLTVDLKVPTKVKVGDKVEITATVKHGDEAVNQADEVMFELIKDKDMKNSVKEKVKNAEKGVYTLEYIFKEKGNYNVISHVTAHNQHTMPNADITVE